jgi:hypothetical protein
MRWVILVLALGALAPVTTVYARDIGTKREMPFDYSCKVDGKTYPLRVDEDKKVLEWRGKKYSIVFQPDCAKYGWHAEGNGTSFDFGTATQDMQTLCWRAKHGATSNAI